MKPDTPDTPRTWLRAMAAFVALLVAGQASAWWKSEWPYRKQITLDPASLVQLAGEEELKNVPVLVRLHEGVFHFPDAKPDGSDLRFVSGDDKTPLNFHIERFDPVFNMAQIWVQVPVIAAGKPVQVWMYYGNPDAPSPEESPAMTYDNTHLLVYHFGERGKPAQDISINRLHATSSVLSADGGMVGALARFDGVSAMQLPSSPLLTFLPTQPLTVSAWVKPATAQATGVIYAQRDASGAEFVFGLNAGVPYVSVADVGGVSQTSSPADALTGGKWFRMAAVADATHIRVFVDGNQVATLERTLPALSGAASLGGVVQADGKAAKTFTGDVDEFSISNVARSPAWLALEAGNQGSTDTFVVLGDDEQQSSMSTGYMGVILGSLTIDGWIVIVLCGLMMVLSWYVMAAKGMQIARTGKANQAFLAAYAAAGGDLSRLHRALVPGAKADLGLDDEAIKLLAESPVVRMFNTGIHELQQRIEREETARQRSGAEAPDASRPLLTEQSIEAIRASLNAVFVREQQMLSKRMVLLTIAISGGPFLGLLGTVVGVMITFAAVAAAGDVNVNAIAPGIAAALAATVAGLGVAIPALFGYNYLITRIKECAVEMQVFVDVFVTRIAESYNDPQALHALADE